KTCKHIAALMIAVANEKRTHHIAAEQADAFFSGVLGHKRLSITPLGAKIPMKVEYLLHIDRWRNVRLECKTGISHRYVIRNLREFVGDVLRGDPYFFTHKFTYEPTLHQFEEADLEVLGILQTISETMDVYTDHHFDIASAT